MTEEVLKRIFRLLETRIGHNAQSLHKDVWTRALRERMAMTGIGDPEAYYQNLITHPNEFQEFVEQIVVPETWFFRDRVSSEFVVDYCWEKWIRHKHPVRVLSAPCSTGEEAYSLAMLFHQKAIPANYVNIDAVDLSKRALIRADLAVYGKNSFRGRDMSFRDAYFSLIDTGLQLNRNIRRQVHLSYGNLCDPHFPDEKLHYNIILCRNLLIYLSQYAQKNLVNMFRKLLVKGGVLVVSPAESEVVRREGFIPVGHAKYSAFLAPDTVKNIGSKVAASSINLEKESSKAHESEKALLKTGKHFVRGGELLQEASKLADEGHFTEALETCLAFLQKAGPHAEAYFLAGVIQQALGEDNEAEKYFFKAVYLDPQHVNGLIYLSLLADKRGEKEKAELYRQRAKKITPQKDEKEPYES